MCTLLSILLCILLSTLLSTLFYTRFSTLIYCSYTISYLPILFCFHQYVIYTFHLRPIYTLSIPLLHHLLYTLLLLDHTEVNAVLIGLDTNSTIITNHFNRANCCVRSHLTDHHYVSFTTDEWSFGPHNLLIHKLLIRVCLSNYAH